VQVIRELREEVEKLRALIGSGGKGGAGGGSMEGGGNSVKEVNELQDRLRISEGLMTEMTKTWEQRLLDTERIHQERQSALENMGISVQAAGIGVQVDKFYMVNLNADPSLNELLVCYLKVRCVAEGGGGVWEAEVGVCRVTFKWVGLNY
jgi:kinesin family protein 13